MFLWTDNLNNSNVKLRSQNWSSLKTFKEETDYKYLKVISKRQLNKIIFCFTQIWNGYVNQNKSGWSNNFKGMSRPWVDTW